MRFGDKLLLVAAIVGMLIALNWATDVMMANHWIN